MLNKKHSQLLTHNQLAVMEIETTSSQFPNLQLCLDVSSYIIYNMIYQFLQSVISRKKYVLIGRIVTQFTIFIQLLYMFQMASFRFGIIILFDHRRPL